VPEGASCGDNTIPTWHTTVGVEADVLVYIKGGLWNTGA